MSSAMASKASPSLSGWSPYVKVYDPLKAGSIDGTDLDPHDHAVVRAMAAKYKPPDGRTVASDPSLTLFVGRLNLRTSERQLTEEFSKYGRVKSCRVIQDIVTGISRGYGFVEFKKEADAQNAWRQAHMSVFHERQILVEWEFGRTLPGWIPRRLGGGLGGKKESGQLRFGGRDRPFRRPLILPPDQQEEAQSSITDGNVSSSKFCERIYNDLDGREEDPRATMSGSLRNGNYGNFNTEDGKKYGRSREQKFVKQPYNSRDVGKYKSRMENQGYYEEDRRDHHRYKEEKFQDQSYYGDDRRKSRKYPPDDNYGDWSYPDGGREKYRRHDEEHYTNQWYSSESGKKYRNEKYEEKSKYKKDYYHANDKHDRKRHEKEQRGDYEEAGSSLKEGYSSSSCYPASKDIKKHSEQHSEDLSSDRKNDYNTLSLDARESEPEVSRQFNVIDRIEKFGSTSKRSRASSASSNSQVSSSKKKRKKSKHKKKKYSSDSDDSSNSVGKDVQKQKKRKKSKKSKKSKKRRFSDKDSD